MENSDLLMQAFQYVLGVIPGDIAGNIVSVVTVIVTICTLIIRFWKEPNKGSKSYKLWQLLHVLASFKRANKVKEKENEIKSS